MSRIDVVSGVIINKNKVLITQRGDKTNYGKWEFPGGKIKVGENEFSSIKRELMEELNLQVTPLKKLTKYTHDHFNLIFIECSCLEPKSIKLTEHTNYLWVKLDKLNDFDFLDGDKRFINHHLSLLGG